MKTVLLLAASLSIALPALALDGVSCNPIDAQALDEASARQLIKGDPITIIEPDELPGVEWSADQGYLRLAMFWTTNCLLYVETKYGTRSHSGPYSCDAGIERLYQLDRRGDPIYKPRCKPNGPADVITIDRLGSASTDVLLDQMSRSGTAATLGGRAVILSNSEGLHIFLPNDETIGLETPLFLYRTGPQWRRYDLSAYGLPNLIARFEKEIDSPAITEVWPLP